MFPVMPRITGGTCRAHLRSHQEGSADGSCGNQPLLRAACSHRILVMLLVQACLVSMLLACRT